MSRKRTKQYLMLLMVIGLVSIAAGGSGTFASFSAETANNGNYFATGTLILNDNGGNTTCTSAAASNNLNTGANNGCDTLFNVSSAKLPYAVITTTINNGDLGVTSLAFTGGLLEGPISTGDTIVIDDGSGNTQTLTAASDAAVSDTSVTVDSFDATNDYLSGTAYIQDVTPTYFAKLTLTNAGTIDARGISFKRSGSCSTTNQLPTGTLTGALGASPVTQIPVASVSGGVPGGYSDGDPVIVTHSSPAHVQTFTADGDQDAATIASNGYILVNSETPNYSGYTTGDAVGGPSFSSPSVADFCTALKFSVIEESDSTFTTPVSCAYGTPSGSTCNLSSGTALGSVPSGSLTDLNLASNGGSGNTGTFLNKSGVRYFLLAIKSPDVSAFTNGDQNKATSAFGLTWHIDQA